jgi:hypothetical protein
MKCEVQFHNRRMGTHIQFSESMEYGSGIPFYLEIEVLVFGFVFGKFLTNVVNLL